MGVALFVLSLFTFALVRLLPGNVSDALLGAEGSQAAKQAIIQRYGLDKPLPIQYAIWLGRVVHGDLGETAVGRRPVMQEILGRAEPSLSIALVGICMAVVVGVPLGTMAGLRPNTLTDKTLTTLGLASSSVPDFVIGLVLILLVAQRFSFFPTFGYVHLSAGYYQWFRHIILPAFTLSALVTGLLTRLTRATVVEMEQQEFVRTARGKGLSGSRILMHHIVRPSLIPIVTTASLYFVAAIGGIVVVEVVFSIPGVGRLIVEAIAARDYAVIQGVTLLIGVLAIVISFAVDVSYRLLDPRVRGD
jgi:peptide/nickel transport system permease protein